MVQKHQVYLHLDVLVTHDQGDVNNTASGVTALENNKPPVTSKIYYGPEMTFGGKSATVVKSVGRIYYRFDT